jgi:hypothetical protein
MNWIPLISAVTRLVDLHDSNRTPGSTGGFGADRESRGENQRGLWLDVATLALEFILAREREHVGEWAATNEIRDAVKSVHPELNRDDVAFVLDVLSRPTAFSYIDSDTRRNVSAKTGALIKRSYAADAYQLTDEGRMACTLSTSFFEIAYAQSEAERMRTAIRLGHYAKVPELADELVTNLRRAHIAIKRSLESGRPSETTDYFIEHAETIVGSLEGAGGIVKDADALLDQPSIRQKVLDAYGASGLKNLRESLTRVFQSLNAVSNAFLQLVEAALKGTGSNLKPISFEAIAFALSMKSYDTVDETFDTLIAAYGPLLFRSPFISPFHYIGSIDAEPREVVSMPSEDAIDALYTPTAPALRLCEPFLDAIIDALKLGPVALSDAILAGWVDIGDPKALGQMVGVFLVPRLLTKRGVSIRVSMRSVDSPTIIPHVGRFTSDNLFLEMSSL